MALGNDATLTGLDPVTGEVDAQIVAPGPIRGLFNGSLGLFGDHWVAAIEDDSAITGTGNILEDVADTFLELSPDLGTLVNVAPHSDSAYLGIFTQSSSDLDQTVSAEIPRDGSQPLITQPFAGIIETGSGCQKHGFFFLLDGDAIHAFNDSWSTYSVADPSAPSPKGPGLGSGASNTWWRLNPDLLPPGGPPGQPGAPELGGLPGTTAVDVGCTRPDGSPIDFHMAFFATAGFRMSNESGLTGTDPTLFRQDPAATEPLGDLDG